MKRIGEKFHSMGVPLEWMAAAEHSVASSRLCMSGHRQPLARRAPESRHGRLLGRPVEYKLKWKFFVIQKNQISLSPRIFIIPWFSLWHLYPPCHRARAPVRYGTGFSWWNQWLIPESLLSSIAASRMIYQDDFTLLVKHTIIMP